MIEKLDWLMTETLHELLKTKNPNLNELEGFRLKIH